MDAMANVKTKETTPEATMDGGMARNITAKDAISKRGKACQRQPMGWRSSIVVRDGAALSACPNHAWIYADAPNTTGKSPWRPLLRVKADLRDGSARLGILSPHLDYISAKYVSVSPKIMFERATYKTFL